MARPDAVNSVAALLDGTLSPAEREELLERLARSPEEYEVLVEAAALQRDLEAEDRGAEGDVVPASPVAQPAPPPSVTALRPRWRVPRAAVGLALAAGVAGVLLLPRLGGRGLSAMALLEGDTLVSTPGDNSLRRELGANWIDAGLRRTRGGGGSVDDPHLEFGIGVRLAQVEIAFGADDATAVKDAVRELNTLLADVTGGSAMAMDYDSIEQRSVPGALGALEAERVRARENLAVLFEGSAWFELGLWAEQARLAVRANQAGFFSERAAQVLDDLVPRIAEEREEADPLTRELRKLQRLSADGVTSGELDAVRAALAEVMKEAG